MTKTLLPSTIVSYCRALLSAPWKFNLVFLSLIHGVSHDHFTRLLHKKYHWKQVLAVIASSVCTGGYLIVDETEVNKLYSKIATGLSWIWSHKEGRYVYGYQIILLCWTNGRITFPLAWKIYQKNGKTKTDLTIELMHYCLFVLRIHPKAFLFDAFYASERILRYLTQHHQSYFTQVPKNRLFNGVALKNHEKGRPYWTKVGTLKGNIQVQIVKNRRKYYITNQIGISRKEQLDTYKLRWRIEEVFRFVKSELGLEQCQSTSKQAQHNHIGCCFVTFALLQDIAAKTQMTVYRIKQQATLNHDFANMLDLTVFFNTA